MPMLRLDPHSVGVIKSIETLRTSRDADIKSVNKLSRESDLAASELQFPSPLSMVCRKPIANSE